MLERAVGSVTVGGTEVLARVSTDPPVTPAQPLPAARDQPGEEPGLETWQVEKSGKKSFQTLGLPLHTGVITLCNGN